MALISQAGFVSMVFIILTITPDSVVGTRTRLLHTLHDDSGDVARTTPADSTSSGLRLTGTQGSEDWGEDPRNSWRKLFAHRRPPVDSSEPASTNHQLEGQASKTSLLPSPFHSHIAAASKFSFRLFASMAKGSTSPSPATPSPGHN